MGFVYDNEIPVDLLQSRQDFRALGKVKRRDDLFLFQPLVDSELVTNVSTFQDEEFLIELFFQLPLPLELQVRRTDDKNTLGKSAQLEFTDEEAGHDGFSGSGVVGEQETDTR